MNTLSSSLTSVTFNYYEQQRFLTAMKFASNRHNRVTDDFYKQAVIGGERSLSLSSLHKAFLFSAARTGKYTLAARSIRAGDNPALLTEDPAW